MVFDDEKFGELVDEAWSEIPSRFRDALKNVVIVVNQRPSIDQLGRIKTRGMLLGLFEGVPVTAWGAENSANPPDMITLFKENILKSCSEEKQLRRMIKIVLMHEVAHYFGYNEDDMCTMDARLRRKLSSNEPLDRLPDSKA